MYSTNTRAASMTPTELNNRLIELGMTKADLAALLGVDERAVRRWTAEPNVKTAIPVPAYVRTVLDLHARQRDAQSLFKKRG
jgi:predicted transcriptional regulator